LLTLKPRDIAARLNVSEKTVYKWLNDGVIPARRMGRTWVVTEEGLEAALSPSRQAAASTRAVATQPAARADRDSAVAMLQRFTSLAETAIDEGILAILRPRRLADDASRAIDLALDTATGEVLLMGIGLRDFFGDQGHTLLIQRMIDEDRPVHLRAVLVDPSGNFARARAVAEQGPAYAEDKQFLSGPLYGDSWRSLNVISAMQDRARSGRGERRFRMEVRFADYWPSAHLVMTPDSCFVEPYSFGRPPGSLTGSTIDGLVPMLQLAARSRYYETMRAHFEHIWGGQNRHVKICGVDDMRARMREQ